MAMNEQQKLALARRQLSAIEGFYIHAGIFIVTMLALTILDVSTGESLWFYWVLLGWGAGVLLHAAIVFGRSPRAIERWENRKLDEIKRRLDEESRPPSAGS